MWDVGGQKGQMMMMRAGVHDNDENQSIKVSCPA